MTQPLSPRAEKAALIAANPEAYKICEGCDSIVAARAATCPNCHAYRFDADPESVRQHATALGARDQVSVVAEDLV